MTNLPVLQPWLFDGLPGVVSINVCHQKSDGYRYLRWTLPIPTRVNPLKSCAFLNDSTNIIHPAPSRSAALDQAILDCIFCAESSNICPLGSTERAFTVSLVERLRLYDGACKARFAYRWRTLQLFIAGAIQSLHGSFDFRWGETSSRIFDLLSQIKNRNSHYCARAQSFLCATWVAHSSKISSRLNTLRVAERNFTVKHHE